MLKMYTVDVQPITTEERILHWIHAIQIRYFETLADSTDYLVQWFDRPNYASVGFQEVEIKISKRLAQQHVESHTSSEDSDDAMKNNSVLVIAIHIYLTRGIIMFQGTGYKLWAQKEFPELKKLVDLSCNNVTQPDGSIPRVEQINFEQTEHLLKTLNDAENLLPGKTKGTKKKSNHQSVIPEKPRAAGLTQVL